LADALQIEDGLVLQELRAASSSATTQIRQRPRPAREPREAEARLVSELLRLEEERVRLVGEIDWADLECTQIGPIVRTILRLTEEGKPVDYPTVLSAVEDADAQSLLTRIAFREQPEQGPSVEDCLWAFRRKRLTQQGREAVRELDQTQAQEHQQEDDEVDRRLLQVQRLARQRDALLTDPSQR
jgi:hypothetical protein